MGEKSSARRVVHDETRTFASGVALARGAPMELVGAVPVPARAPLSYALGGSSVTWEVRVALYFRGLPTWTAVRPILVVP